jgi:hypothetical protein
MSTITHFQAARDTADFPAEAKLKINSNIWSEGCAGHRFYTAVLAQKPATVGKALDLAEKLEQPFTVKQVQAHLKWMFTANGGALEVDGVSYTPKTKEPKAVKAPKAKPEPKAKKPEGKAAATHQRRMVRTKKLTKRAA